MPCRIEFAGTAIPTSATNAMTGFGHKEICPRVGVSGGAVGFVAFLLPRVATANVLSGGDWLQVRRVTAGAIAAEVVEFETFRYRPDVVFVHGAVGAFHTLATSPNPHVSVTVSGESSGENPASVVVHVELGFDPLNDGCRFARHRSYPFGVMPPVVLATRGRFV